MIPGNGKAWHNTVGWRITRIMNRNRMDPLGVPNVDYDFDDSREPANRSEPNALDRWLVGQLRSRLGESRIALALWDEAETRYQDKAATVRFGDRSALWQVLMNPGLHFGDLYSAGRLKITGDILAVLDEASRSTNPHRAVKAARSSQISRLRGGTSTITTTSATSSTGSGSIATRCSTPVPTSPTRA